MGLERLGVKEKTVNTKEWTSCAKHMFYSQTISQPKEDCLI